DEINGVLVSFIKKYSKELGHPEVGNLVKTNNATQSLEDVLVSTILVRRVNTCLITIMFIYMKRLAGDYGHTLFVGVDEYDAPVNNSVFTGDTIGMPDAIKKVSQIEQFFKTSFFATLKEGCGGLGDGRSAIIGKY